MIIFDLRCRPDGHVFEAWFGSSADYEDQQARGLVSCPICGSAIVEKAPMAPAVGRKGAGAGTSTDMVAGDPEAVKAMLGTIAAMQRKLLERSEWVGPRFASEARAIHVGDKEQRPIHGQATRAEAEQLRDDGVPVAPLLLPIVPPGEEH